MMAKQKSAAAWLTETLEVNLLIHLAPLGLSELQEFTCPPANVGMCIMKEHAVRVVNMQTHSERTNTWAATYRSPGSSWGLGAMLKCTSAAPVKGGVSSVPSLTQPAFQKQPYSTRTVSQ